MTNRGPQDVPTKVHRFHVAGFTADDNPTEEQWDSLIRSVITGIAAEDIRAVMSTRKNAVLQICTPCPGSLDAEVKVTDVPQIAAFAELAGIKPVGSDELVVLIFQPICDPTSVRQFKLLYHCKYRRPTKYQPVVFERFYGDN
jgi:hypothetical protein